LLRGCDEACRDTRDEAWLQLLLLAATVMAARRDGTDQSVV